MPRDLTKLIGELPEFDPTKASAFTGYCDFVDYYQLHFSPLSTSQHLGQIEVDGLPIAVHLFRHAAPRGTLLITHGYLDHHGIYRHLIRYGLERELNVLCYDLPGHGLSGGPRASIGSFEQYQPVLKALLDQVDTIGLQQPLHLLGQSTGAAILNHYLLRERPDLDGRVALLAPLVRAARWPWVSLAHRFLSPWKTSVRRSFHANSNDAAFCAWLPRDPLQSQQITSDWVGAMKRWIPDFLALPAADYPVLIIQGQQDNTVDWRYNLAVLKQKFPHQQQLLIPEARHQLANESADIRNNYLSWLDQQGFARKPTLINMVGETPCQDC